MIILNVERRIEVNYYVETDDELFPYYRRSEHGNWENLIGESWESVYGLKEMKLESLFQRNVSK